jgi:hypothetical protein
VKGKEKNMNIVNLTPHSITILNEAKEIVQVVSRSGKVARLDINKELIPAQKEGYFNHKIPFFFTKYGIPYLVKLDEEGNEIERCQLPGQKEGIIYIVPGLFRASCPRDDLWQPGELVRDNEGRPIGCVGLSQ